jgi:hypothetical protein
MNSFIKKFLLICFARDLAIASGTNTPLNTPGVSALVQRFSLHRFLR